MLIVIFETCAHSSFLKSAYAYLLLQTVYPQTVWYS
jgi:hypothetical protein